MRAGHRRAHRRIWAVLSVALPLVLLGAMLLRQGGPLEAPAERIAPP